MTNRKMWAVGLDDGDHWAPVNAKTAAAAIDAYAAENELCCRSGIIAQRVAAWDALEKVTKLDWFSAGGGLYATCDDCGDMASTEIGGGVVDGSVLCAHCLPVKSGGSDA